MTFPAHLSGQTDLPIAVIGAGITGLTAAYRLTQLGRRVRIFEQRPTIGGVIRTQTTDGWLMEEGPNSLLSGEPALMQLIAELGVANEIEEANPAAKRRYLVKGGRVVPAPLSPPAFLKSPLFSIGTKLRFLAELTRRPRHRSTDLSLADLVREHFGQELVDYGLNPFVTGVYAGDPEKLSARLAFPKLWALEQKHGSLLRGQISAARAARQRGETPRRIFSFRHGLQTLPTALAARLPADSLVCGAQVEAVIPGRPWKIGWRKGGATQMETCSHVVAALPARSLAELTFGPSEERPLSSLEKIEHPPVASLFLGYRREQVAHPLDGFGLLVPAVEKRALLGILFSSTLFAGRAPPGHVALTVLAGGTRQPELARLEPAELLAAIETDLQALLGLSGRPVFTHHAVWPFAIPQYNLGYEQHLETIAALEQRHPGLLIGGQACDGIALPACVAAGEKLAARISAQR